VARLHTDEQATQAYHGVTEREIYGLVMCNDALDASIERLVERRLDRAHGVEALVQVGRFKRQTGKHCVCHASDQGSHVWIGCANKGGADADRGCCQHETGWFHPRCVGLGELRTREEVERFGDWTCPVCRDPRAFTDYRYVFLRNDAAGNAVDDDDDSSDSD
jgi:hypothetical protein